MSKSNVGDGIIMLNGLFMGNYEKPDYPEKGQYFKFLALLTVCCLLGK